jgi:tetratricopeptide (TPR) repeat protein
MKIQRALPSAILVLVLATTLSFTVGAQTNSHPVTASELLALIAGESLDQNVVHLVESRGLAFRPTDQYRSLLTTAGVNPSVLDALKRATISENATDPDQPDTFDFLRHLAMAGKFIRAKQFDKAIVELAAAARSHIGPESGFVMGDVQDKTGDYWNASKIYSRVLQMSPEFPGAHTRLSFNLYRFGDSNGAMREARTALLQFSDDPEAHKNLGLGMQIAGAFDAAIGEYREALRLKPDYDAVHFDLSIIFMKRHQIEDEIVELNKAITLAPNEADYHYNLGVALKNTDNIDGSIREYRTTKRLDPSRLEARQNLGAALSTTDREGAKAEFRELIAMAPEFQTAHLGLGFVYLSDRDYKQAEKEYRKAAELDPSDADAYVGIGDALEHQGAFQGAMAQYRHALELEHNNARAHIGLGRAYLDTKDYRNAAAELRKASNLNPTSAEAHSLLSQALANSSNNPQ